MQEIEDKNLVQLAIKHLKNNDLYGKKTSILPPVDLKLPKLVGDSLDEHFYKLGVYASEPYLSKAKQFASQSIPDIPTPDRWVQQSGWTKYHANGNTPIKVDYPDEKDALVLDVEVLYKISDFPIFAVAVSNSAWYCWVSPWFLGESESPRHLIPLGSEEEKLVIGHNVSYDRQRIKEEYSIHLSNSMFLDTMSLHIAVSGMCSRQRPDMIRVKRAKKSSEDVERDATAFSLLDEEIGENPWIQVSSLNNLADVAYLHCGIQHDKGVRDSFGKMTRQEARDQFNKLVDYCARDVATTFEVYKHLLPKFLTVIPHPVSFAGIRHMGSLFLPINHSWEKYLADSERCYEEHQGKLYDSLVKLANTAVELRDTPEKWRSDPWLRQLDWTITPIKMVKPKKKGELPRPAKRQKLPGYPKWYKDLFPTANSPMNISVRCRTAVFLLRLQWDGNPLIWSQSHGFVFKVPKANKQMFLDKNYSLADMNNDPDLSFKDDANSVYFKIPHKDGPKAKCTSPMTASYYDYFDKKILSSEYDLAAEALKVNMSCSYWAHNRERAKSQLAIWSDDTNMGIKVQSPKDFGMILPSLITMGTVTRRAVEKTWLTASNAKKNRIGSEQKSMIQAPPGHKFVGADVDSEELWIASLLGDSMFKIHGGTALGWMTLEGTKSEGTDLHSKTASILGISRNEAKVFNYGRIYGAGVTFAAQLLKQFNPRLTEKEAKETAKKLYSLTKGVKSHSESLKLSKFWRSGSESLIFNRLEEMADQETPRTPVLGATITEALQRKNLKKSSFLTSRINWTIQSSGVDYLHLLITSMHYLIKKYGISARLFVTVHDEIRYMVKEEDAYRVALALQISNIWTRAMFCHQVGINDLPLSCAFFSSVDIDHVLRKEVDLDCVTLSHPNPIKPGSSIDIFNTLKVCSTLDKPNSSKFTQDNDLGFQFDFDKVEYQPITPVILELDSKKGSLVPSIAAQISTSTKELRAVEYITDHCESDWSSFFTDEKKTLFINGKSKTVRKSTKDNLKTVSKQKRVTKTGSITPVFGTLEKKKKKTSTDLSQQNKKKDVSDSSNVFDDNEISHILKNEIELDHHSISDAETYPASSI